jgi:hypothetical protein
MEDNMKVYNKRKLMQTRNAFKFNIPATKTALEVVYSDVCGLMEPVSL